MRTGRNVVNSPIAALLIALLSLCRFCAADVSKVINPSGYIATMSRNLPQLLNALYVDRGMGSALAFSCHRPCMVVLASKCTSSS